ncbi:hypothetical protein AMAG_16183 [Allomyces macrogynus ATCC 38327]|uniref:Thioredoxin domain-containing protein n=1 Tax=Allomyces macrogynus (strain ATCC 38327) TaxID=578462 RepID=A0A0L0TA94_ALLM3|nr:hypothetical protein AMAG_16183 [Allomyces macrogynus ATCC 38327]|eukprot:KNE71625.1 hypothetical protein AMAG_16183 [Allomyces macrogynus ATCC 38327]
MKAKRINDAAEFETTIAEIVAAAPGPVYVVFFGTELPETGESFCPDCVVADPTIRRALLAHANSANLTLVEVPIGDRASWRSADNFYRAHEQIQLERIPTLIRWTADGAAERLVEDDCADADKLAAFLG